jgi:ribonuclease-3
MEKNKYSKVEKKLGYKFSDLQILEEAFTHRSYRFEQKLDYDNQRLEFLGDAVLGFLLADYVYRKQEDQPEGVLTVLRSNVASGVALAELAAELELGEYLALGKGEKQSGGETRESNLADLMEAVLGAVYIDGGLDAIRTVFNKLFKKGLKNMKTNIWQENPKGFLQHVSQKYYNTAPTYEIISKEGPMHKLVFTAEATIPGTAFKGQGQGQSKQMAQVNAAIALLKQLPEAKNEQN